MLKNMPRRLPSIVRFWQKNLGDRLNIFFGKNEDLLPFQCNVCGRMTSVPSSRLKREEPSCRCGSTLRTRSLIHVLTTELLGKSVPIPDIPMHSELVGIDMSGAAVYADKLDQCFNYTNTFLHKEPRLDVTAPEAHWFGSCDFVVSSDVLEHVRPPVSDAFDNILKMLKPGGLLVMTVPYRKDGTTQEHFPDLNSYRIEGHGKDRVLVNTRADGQIERYEDLVFHGGDGDTLEMRVFSESSILRELADAGFDDIRIHDEPMLQFGIVWTEQWSLPISARRPITE